jgi:hypothetical protein
MYEFVLNFKQIIVLIFDWLWIPAYVLNKIVENNRETFRD